MALVIAGGGGANFTALQQRLRYSSPARTAQLVGEMRSSGANPRTIDIFCTGGSP